MNEAATTYQMHAIGTVQREDGAVCLEIAAPYRPALLNLDRFSHVMVFWWPQHVDTEAYRGVLQVDPPYAAEHRSGVFATRSPVRPNPIAMTTCKLLGVDEAAGVVRVANIDAFDGTPIVDLKAYFPVCDRVRTAHIPPWLSDWPAWMPEDGIGLEEGEDEA